MNAETRKPKAEGAQPVTGLELLRMPFPEHHISKLPKPTKKQTEDVKADFKKGIRCAICGSWHHPDVVHLDYVGHAALTDRLLDADPNWSWEPMGTTPEGLPAINGGLWIKLTVCGVSRYGYGAADGKSGGDAIKEMIGDALRNAAMRFGAALDLWHKGDLHIPADGEPEGAGEGQSQGGEVSPPSPKPRVKLDGPYTSRTALQTAVKAFVHELNGCGDYDELHAFLHTKDSLALIEQVQRDAVDWWEGSPDMPPEFVPLSVMIERAEETLGRAEGQRVNNMVQAG